MLLMQDLRKWHDLDNPKNIGKTCMYSPIYSEELSELAIKFNRRSGIRCAIAKQGDTVIARGFIDKDKNFTRIYYASSISKNAIEGIYKSAGFIKNNVTYNGFGYARLTRDEEYIYAPYLDGEDKRIDIIDYDITAKNGNRFVKFEFNGTEVNLRQTGGTVKLDGCTCSQCGVDLDDDAYTQYFSNGEPVCEECSAYCEECEETVLSQDMTNFFYRTRRGDLEEGYCCQSCADNMLMVPFRV